MTEHTPRVLVVDDLPTNRKLLRALLESQQYDVDEAEGGVEALQLMGVFDYDVVLLDLMMPGMDGTDVLRVLRADPDLSDIPVLMVSAYHELPAVVQCIQLGAVDYIGKPFDTTLLRARVQACVERRRLRRMQRSYVATLDGERRKVRELLCNILPESIADRMLRGETTIAETFAEVTVLFADVVGFTPMSAQVPPDVLMQFLRGLFREFDRLTRAAGMEKIKTIGDAYMAVGGLPLPLEDHVATAARLALALRAEVANWRTPLGGPVQLRIGIHTGPVVAGVIGDARIAYDLWGDVVNTASRMESHGVPDGIQFGDATRDRLGGRFALQERGVVDVKGKGPMRLYLLTGELETGAGQRAA